MGGDPVTRPVLIAGVPRCGSSWALQVLRRTGDVQRVYEPDNEWHHVRAMRAKRGLGRFPVLVPGDTNDRYAALWSQAFAGRAAYRSFAGRRADALFRGAADEERQRVVDGGPPSLRLRAALALAALPDRAPEPPARTPLVKSVHCALALSWIRAGWDVQVVIVARDPRNVLASWLEMDLPDRDRGFDRDARVREAVIEPLGLPDAPASSDPVHRAAWHLGVLTAALDAASPGAHVVQHEALCVDPAGGFRALASDLGLTWTVDCDAFLASADAEGAGFEVRRVASDQPDRWRTRLTPAQADAIAEELARFPSAAPAPPTASERAG
jgi:hypothetical protein